MAPYFFMLTKNPMRSNLHWGALEPYLLGINNIGTDLQAVFLPLS